MYKPFIQYLHLTFKNIFSESIDSISGDSINIIINKDAKEFVVDFNNSVLILSNHKSMNYFKNTNIFCNEQLQHCQLA